ncbi:MULTISPECIES: S49 family peptidase [Comamonadaceae]|uniref:S49 family peptidase n=1 Tax=Simplicispira suum TaxID=2109915 RepID=A0A2S0N5F1_9BURK|nr:MULTISPECIES: S49 family peptidase [Comamonadaceae]ADV02199.1 peptidase S49 [Alicycliphilus denitrificans BC]AVO43384.1 S49 family peptidase [Simplicispira suum]
MWKKKPNATPLSNEDLLRVQIASEKSDLRWKRAKRALVAVMAAWGLAGVWLASDLGPGKSKAHVPVIRIEGGIAGDSTKINADSVNKLLAKAFDDDSASAVVLYIDSPGGSPAEADRIGSFIARKKQETGKPLYSVCANMCASAGYMIAMHGDEIYASKYSLIGSIGAILSSWNFSQAIGKVGVQHNAYASGKLKAMLNPYAPVKAGDVEKAQELVDGMGKVFAEQVRFYRKGKLTSKVDLFTGEVWSGEEAKTYGLVDVIGTLDDVVHDKFPDGSQILDMDKSGGGFRLLRSASQAISQGIQSGMLAHVPLMMQ